MLDGRIFGHAWDGRTFLQAVVDVRRIVLDQFLLVITIINEGINFSGLSILMTIAL